MPITYELEVHEATKQAIDELLLFSLESEIGKHEIIRHLNLLTGYHFQENITDLITKIQDIPGNGAVYRIKNPTDIRNAMEALVIVGSRTGNANSGMPYRSLIVEKYFGQTTFFGKVEGKMFGEAIQEWQSDTGALGAQARASSLIYAS